MVMNKTTKKKGNTKQLTKVGRDAPLRRVEAAKDLPADGLHHQHRALVPRGLAEKRGEVGTVVEDRVEEAPVLDLQPGRDESAELDRVVEAEDFPFPDEDGRGRLDG